MDRYKHLEWIIPKTINLCPPSSFLKLVPNSGCKWHFWGCRKNWHYCYSIYWKWWKSAGYATFVLVSGFIIVICLEQNATVVSYCFLSPNKWCHNKQLEEGDMYILSKSSVHSSTLTQGSQSGLFLTMTQLRHFILRGDNEGSILSCLWVRRWHLYYCG